MTNLKEELNQYLSRNDSTRNGTSMTAGLKTLGKLFKKPDSEDNEDLLTSNQKYFYHDFCPALVNKNYFTFYTRLIYLMIEIT